MVAFEFCQSAGFSFKSPVAALASVQGCHFVRGKRYLTADSIHHSFMFLG